MKFRRGFVSNSSSSSYTCDVCGRTESGFDLSLNDIDMRECIDGHCFCDKDLVGWCSSDGDDAYSIPKENCPICTLTHIQPQTMLNYLLKEYNIEEQHIQNIIRMSFVNLNKVDEYITAPKPKKVVKHKSINTLKKINLRKD